MIVVSSCLAGKCCRYDGKSNEVEQIKQLVLSNQAIMVCPEQLGGLSTPRVPCEIQGNKVMNKEGKDCTKQFKLGASIALKTAQQQGCKVAILKGKSPSCGCGKIYDGTFQGKLINGDGITTQLFKECGIIVFDETMIEKAIQLDK